MSQNVKKTRFQKKKNRFFDKFIIKNVQNELLHNLRIFKNYLILIRKVKITISMTLLYTMMIYVEFRLIFNEKINFRS